MTNIFNVLDIPIAELDAQPDHARCFLAYGYDGSTCIYCEAKILRQYAQNALEDETLAWEDFFLAEAERVRTRADVWEWFNADPPDDGYDD
tara:strand:- start:2184 stop:2456 length:273 start_codon:yes stop_codon:yes gene_type:complete